MTREYAPYPAVNMNRPVIPNDELGGGQQEVVALVAQDGVASRGVLYKPAGGASKVGIHLIHPQADFSTHFTTPAWRGLVTRSLGITAVTRTMIRTASTSV